MQHRKFAWTLLSFGVALVLVLSACSPASPTAAPVATNVPATAAPTFSGAATITFTQEPSSLNPFYTTQWFAFILQDFYLKGLWSFDDQNNPVPELAAEIPSSANGGLGADGKTITVKLNPAITWSDGEPLTADDVVFTFDMVMNDANIVLSRYPYEDFVESVTASDPHTVVIKFKEAFSPWLAKLFTFVLPKHVLQPAFDSAGNLNEAEWNRAPKVGVGPFVFDSWESGSHIIFKANPNWIRPPKLEQVIIRVVPDDAAQEAAIIAGDTDIGVFLSSDQIQKLESGGNVDVVSVPSGYAEGWFFNVNPDTAHPAILDPNVRRAVAMATDRFTIVQDLLDESINPVNATYWDNTVPFGDASIKPYPFDPEAAKTLLDAAGWVDSNGDGTRDKDGQELILRYVTTTRELRKSVQAVVQQQWAEAGIGADLRNFASDEFFAGFADGGPQSTGEYDIAEYSDAPSFPDPERSEKWLCSEVVNADNPDGGNEQGYCNAEMDKLLKEQAVTLDPAKRLDLYHQIEKLMYDEAIYVGIWKDPDLWSISSRLKNVKLSGAFPFWNAGEWSVGS